MSDASTHQPRPAAASTPQQQQQQDTGTDRAADRAPRSADEAAAPGPAGRRPRPFSDWAII